MTLQEPEIIYDGNRQCEMLTHPLEEYFSHHGRPSFQFQKTSLRRGYIGTWRFDKNILLLEGVEGDLEGGGKFDCEEYFGKSLPIHAEWVTGSIYLGSGKMIRVEGSFNPIFEKQEEISLENGLITNRVFKKYNKKKGEYIIQ